VPPRGAGVDQRLRLGIGAEAHVGQKIDNRVGEISGEVLGDRVLDDHRHPWPLMLFFGHPLKVASVCMLYAAETDGACWWCRIEPADSREHKLKRTDLVRQFGPGPYRELTSTREDRTRTVQGPNSVLVKFKPTMCAKCNNEHSQPLDRAYDQFTAYLHERERHVLASRSVDLRAVYGRDWKTGRDGLLRYMAKHVGCRLAENDIELPDSIRRYLNGGPEPCSELALEFEIRADIAKASKTILAEGSMWLGDVYISEFDADGHPLVIESHYGYRWLRVAWGVGSDLEGYPWPFGTPVQPLPHGPTEPRGKPAKLRPSG
jgi:hypothetical protein